ncbi:unnamed protein product [Rhizoctonia solani]|uniref:Protein kinase domain-containing protein n=1 Tax=Rhizoctonia solani TaxID=456999 RepID=A0A8H3CH21_9AGAM|nr:unnamed protein product [Rhizoctonia solani]
MRSSASVSGSRFRLYPGAPTRFRFLRRSQVPELEDEPGDENGNGAIHWTDGMKSFIKLCLRIDASQRPTPGKMLEHPWIQESIARKLDMSKWIREVWGWEKPPKSKRASQA